MSAIWLLSTKGRPYQCQQVLDACERTGMTSEGIVWVDGDSYPDLRLPGNWSKREVEWGGLRPGMQWVFENYPDASQYGWLADDMTPTSNGWDTALEERAGDWRLSYAFDGWLATAPIALFMLERGLDMGGAPCWGGELVREVGWWAPPKMKQGGIDFVWTTLLRDLDLHYYDEEVRVLHRHWRNSARVKDATDVLPHVEHDVELAKKYVQSKDFKRIRGKLERLAVAA